MQVRVKIPEFYASAATLVEELNPGDYADDGSIYLGLFHGKDWFVEAKGSTLLRSFNDAAEYARKLDVHGHKDWQVPPGLRDKDHDPPNILREMFNAKDKGAFKGSYDETGKEMNGWYWSCTNYQYSYPLPYGWNINFKNGDGSWRVKNYDISLRCVRSQPRKQP